MNSRPLRVAALGMGWWSDVLADAAKRSRDIEIVACFTRSEDKRRAYAAKYGCWAAASYEDILKDSSIEAIINTTPNNVHLETTHMAADAGKHVFLSLNVEERGQGPAFIFIPGLVGLFNAWEFQMAEFSKRYHCISFDHRGAGDSDKPQNAYATELIARDVIALMDTLGIDNAHVAGTSTGGCVMQNLAIDHPDRLRCCIFSNTWVKADEYITRVQMTRKQIALAYGPEEYVKVSSLFTNGAAC